MIEKFDEASLEASIRQNFEEISDLVSEYDRQDQVSGFKPYSSENRLLNLIQGLSAKLRRDENLSETESLERADEIVRNAEKEFDKPTVRERICAMADSGTADVLALIPLLIDLAKSGLIVISFDPTGSLYLGAGLVFLARLGIKAYCAR